MALGDFRKLVSSTLTECTNDAEVSQMRAFLLRESETECNKREEYYQSRQAELSKDYAAQVESIEEEYRTAVQQVREELGRSTTEAANSGNNAVEESKAKEEEESPVERFLRRIGYEEDAGRGVITATPRGVRKVEKARDKLAAGDDDREQLIDRYEALGLDKVPAKLAADLHWNLALWHLGSKRLPALGTLPVNFTTALNRVDTGELPDEVKRDLHAANLYGQMYKTILMISHGEKIRQYVCRSGDLLQSEDELERDIIRMSKFIAKKTVYFMNKLQRKAAFARFTQPSHWQPTSLSSLISGRIAQRGYFYAQLKQERDFEVFLENEFREQRPTSRPRKPKPKPSKRKRIDKDHAYFGVSTVEGVKAKRKKLLGNAESDFEERSCYLLNELLRATQNRSEHKDIIAREVQRRDNNSPPHSLERQTSWVADLDSLIESFN